MWEAHVSRQQHLRNQLAKDVGRQPRAADQAPPEIDGGLNRKCRAFTRRNDIIPIEQLLHLLRRSVVNEITREQQGGRKPAKSVAFLNVTHS